MSDRERSASPTREPKPKKQKTAGFKWKDKKTRDDDQAREARDSGRLERGYRDRSPRRDSYRDRGDKRSRRDGDRDGERVRNRSPPRQDTDSYPPKRKSDDVEPSDNPKPTTDSPISTPNPAPKSKKAKQKPPPVPSGPIVVVNINDRLGTKAAIPCLASDSIKAFKAIVAAHIGRQPHEILLKRQGERPFKDQLTLEDYGVSNGVQLDLELDTGD